MGPIAPSTLKLPKLTAAPRPMMGKDSSAKTGLFQPLSAPDCRKESLFTMGCVRHLISKEWPIEFMIATGSIAEGLLSAASSLKLPGSYRDRGSAPHMTGVGWFSAIPCSGLHLVSRC